MQIVMGLLNLFRKRNSFFPTDREGHLEVILKAHREITGNDDVKVQHTLDLLIDLIDGEKDVFILDSYVIYYIGFYKPFADGNYETAKKVADGILTDGGWYMPQNVVTVNHLDEACGNRHRYESIDRSVQQPC